MNQRSRRIHSSFALAVFGLIGAGLLGCGGNKVNLEVSVIVPPEDDPFKNAAQVRVAFMDGSGMTMANMMTTAMVSGGHFDVQLVLDKPTDGQLGYVQLDAMDSGGMTIGRGRTPIFALHIMDANATVYVGRPGRATGTPVSLVDDPSQPTAMQNKIGLRDLSGTVLRPSTSVTDQSLGALLCGGIDGSGNSFKNAVLFEPLTQGLVAAGSPAKARHGAALVPIADATVGQQAVLWGGAVAKNNLDTELPTTAEVFDPSQNLSGIFVNMGVPDPGPPGAVNPVVAEVQSGMFLVCGGHDKDPSVPLAQAVVLSRTNNVAGPVRVPPPMGMTAPMVAPRSGHTATPVNFTDGGPGALIFGGTTDAGMPAAERFALGTMVFKQLALTPMGTGDPSLLGARAGHVAVTLSEGRANDARVLIAGGFTGSGMTRAFPASALIIDPKNGQVEIRDPFLATPRYSATASVVGGEIVICGGLDQNDKPIANCEIFSASTGMRARDPVSLPAARAGHVALLLDTGQLLLAGGTGAGGAPLSALDVYLSP